MNAPSTRPSGRGRGVLAATFGILAVVGVLASVLSVWAHQTLFSSREVGRAVDRALLEPEVVDALADHVTDQLFEALPVTELVEEQIPAQLAPLAPLVVGGLRSVVHDGISRGLSEPATRRVVVAAAERSHRRVMAVLEDGRLVDGLTVEGGTASVNLLPLMGQGFELLQGTGILAGVDLPELDRSGDPATQIRALEAALGRTLPDDFGQLTVYDSEHLARANTAVARAQQALVLFRRSVAVILGVTIVSAIAAIAFSVRRRRALFRLSLGVVGAMAAGRAIVQEVVTAAPSLTVRPGARAAIRTVVTTLAEGLLTAVTVALVVALAVTVMAALTGPSGPGRTVATTLRQNRQVVVLATFAALVVVLSVWAFAPVPLLVVAATGAAAIVVAWRPADDEPPGDAPPEPTTRGA